MKKIIIQLLTISFFAFSCSEDDPKISTVSKTKNYTGESNFEDILNDINDGNSESDDFIIYDVDVSSDSLLVEVGYGGGCKSHEFEIIWPDAIITIFPPEFGVIVNHNANDDLCEAFIQEILYFNLHNNPLGIDNSVFNDMKITVINGSDPDNAVSNRE